MLLEACVFEGFVDVANKFMMAGWAVSLDPKHPEPTISVRQRGRTVLMFKPNFQGDHVWRNFGQHDRLHHPCVWRCYLPLTQGLEPGVPFDVILEETGKPLTRGANQVIPFFENEGADAVEMIRRGTFLATKYVPGSDNSVTSGLRVILPENTPSAPVICRDETALDFSNKPIVSAEFDRDSQSVEVVVRQEDLQPGRAFVRLSVNAQTARDEKGQFDDSLRSVIIPRTAFEPGSRLAPMPLQTNIHRVSGPSSDQLAYLIGGATTFWQLDNIARRYADRSLRDMERVVDWGVGCARVSRQFWELRTDQEREMPMSCDVVGMDVDPVNIEWCKAEMQGFGRFDLLDPNGQLELAVSSVDFLYGISVMTHLTERDQRYWLEEIRRVLKPGGVAALTTHGEYYYLRNQKSVAIPFVERFGFFDALPDSAIGEGRSDIYRATFQSTEYTRNEWGKYLDVLDVVVGTNAFTQDYVILRKPALSPSGFA